MGSGMILVIFHSFAPSWVRCFFFVVLQSFSFHVVVVLFVVYFFVVLAEHAGKGPLKASFSLVRTKVRDEIQIKTEDFLSFFHLQPELLLVAQQCTTTPPPKPHQTSVCCMLLLLLHTAHRRNTKHDEEIKQTKQAGIPPENIINIQNGKL